ncbi:MAG: translation initiation factor [Bacteroidales bacterium]|nr:translation initiation factor [Candidatus Cacconaster caballi]
MQEDWKSKLADAFALDPATVTPEKAPENQKSVVPSPSACGNLIVSIDRRRRAGKQVTLVTGFTGGEGLLQELGKSLKTRCGAGGSVKDGEILLQGDFRNKVVEILTGLGYRAKRGN